MREQNNDLYIFTGGNIDRQILTYINLKNNLIIGVESGIEWLFSQGIIPDYFIGDFDSIDSNLFNIISNLYGTRVNRFDVNKDETDTELALRFAITLRPKSVTIIGGTGSRIDHVLANINILIQAEIENVSAVLLDANNRIQLLFPEKICLVKKSLFKYVSLIAFSDCVEGINTEGFKYLIKNGTMSIGFPYGLSNELIEDTGMISVKKGRLLIIESKD
ncbi:MAG: thiamine diphosphokinase [Vulcanibacillus sp.]